MEPENEPLEEEIPIKNHHFQVPCQFSGGVIDFDYYPLLLGGFPEGPLVCVQYLLSGTVANMASSGAKRNQSIDMRFWNVGKRYPYPYDPCVVYLCIFT